MHKDMSAILLILKEGKLYGSIHVPIQMMHKDVNATLLMSEEGKLYGSAYVLTPQMITGDSKSHEGKLKQANEAKTATLILMFRLMHNDMFQLMFPLMHKDMNTLTFMSILSTYSDDTWVVNGFFIFNMSQFEAQSQSIHFSSSSSEYANSDHASSNDISSNNLILLGRCACLNFCMHNHQWD